MSAKKPMIPKRLYLLLANGEKYEIKPDDAQKMLDLLMDPEQTWIRFPTVDGLTVHLAKAAVIGMENPNEEEITKPPIGFHRK